MGSAREATASGGAKPRRRTSAPRMSSADSALVEASLRNLHPDAARALWEELLGILVRVNQRRNAEKMRAVLASLLAEAGRSSPMPLPLPNDVVPVPGDAWRRIVAAIHPEGGLSTEETAVGAEDLRAGLTSQTEQRRQLTAWQAEVRATLGEVDALGPIESPFTTSEAIREIARAREVLREDRDRWKALRDDDLEQMRLLSAVLGSGFTDWPGILKMVGFLQGERDRLSQELDAMAQRTVCGEVFADDTLGNADATLPAEIAINDFDEVYPPSLEPAKDIVVDDFKPIAVKPAESAPQASPAAPQVPVSHLKASFSWDLAIDPDKALEVSRLVTEHPALMTAEIAKRTKVRGLDVNAVRDLLNGRIIALRKMLLRDREAELKRLHELWTERANGAANV